MSLDPLTEALRTGEFAPAWFLLGEDADGVREAEARIVEAVLDPATAALNRSTRRADEDGAEALFDEARTVPMLSGRRVALLRGLEGATSAVVEALQGYLAAPSPTTVLVVSGSGWPRRSGGSDPGARLRHAVRRAGYPVIAHDVDRRRPEDVVRRLARRLGRRLAPEAARTLVELVGPDPGRLRRELEKLDAWAEEGRELGVGDVEEVCSQLGEADRWALTDALAAGRVDRALEVVHRLGADGVDPRAVLGMVAWRIRQMVEIQEARREGRRAAIRMREPQRRALEASLARRPLRVERVLDALASAGHAMNSGRVPAGRVLERLVLELAVSRSRGQR